MAKKPTTESRQNLMDSSTEQSLIIMRHNKPLRTHHFKGMLDDGRKFVYCPIGQIISWSSGDYDHEWCHWCKKVFDEIKEQKV